MADDRTVRVLTLDGGGTRGYLSATFLKLFVQQWGINPNELWKYFDVIAGTSVGGIQAMGYANGFSPEALQTFFTQDGPWIFSTSSIVPGVRANAYDKIATMLLGGSFYSNANLMTKLNEEFGSLTLTDMKTNVIATAYRMETNSLVYFSNVNFPGSFGQTALVKEVALATASAPLFFLPGQVGDYTYMDGGVFQNNVANTALSVGKIRKPQANRYCVLSIGTGKGDLGFDINPPPPPTPGPDDPPAKPYFQNISKLYSLIGTGITGHQEAVAQDLKLRSQYSMQENLFYYRFQYDLPPEQDTELDNSASSYFTFLSNSATQHYNDDSNNISNFLGHLTL